ncbi:MAG: hypothetical protein R3C44_01685 [Chloroflexota bacterium]
MITCFAYGGAGCSGGLWRRSCAGSGGSGDDQPTNGVATPTWPQRPRCHRRSLIRLVVPRLAHREYGLCPCRSSVEDRRSRRYPAPGDRQFGYGIQVHGNATSWRSVGNVHTVHEQLGMDWVKAQIQWWLVEPSPEEEQWFFYDAVIDRPTSEGCG